MISVSVVIPCFNRAHTIGAAIASVNAQTRAPLELIVVDDASTDGSAAVAERAGAQVIRLAENRGNAAARNVGIKAAAGDAIAALDSDDYWEPHHLATVAGLLDTYSNAAVASAAMRLVGDRSGTWYGRVPAGPPTNVVRQAFYAVAVHTITTVIRRDALASVGGFDETERVAVDFDLWLRLALKYCFVASREVTANYRWHDSQLSSKPEIQVLATYRFRKRVLDQLRRDGDDGLVDELSEIFRSRWEEDLQQAWEQGRMRWLRKVLALEPLIPNPPRAFTRKWNRRSHIPAYAVSIFRACRPGTAIELLRSRLLMR